mmetsp:Transcript_22006/g.35400  ORF Transcript_22006/g.35400 Transcript_22006/m.35400 type:complete len:170 (+) Transcript_22006:2-511(+)
MHSGWPIPFSLLRAQFPDSISDDTLFVALGSCAVLVRGNFCLASRLLALPPAMANARNFLLLLFQSMRVVHRERLMHAFAAEGIGGQLSGTNGERRGTVTPTMIEILLEQLGKKTEEGWVLKVDDDIGFGEKYSETMLLHMQYWARLLEHYQPLLRRYREQPVVRMDET